MNELKAEHKGSGRWQVVNQNGVKVNDGWLDRESAEKMAGSPQSRQNNEEVEKKVRRKRTTFGQTRNKLDLDPETKRRLKAAGKRAYWANDSKGGTRLKELHERGYDFVCATGDEVVGDAVGGYVPPVAGTHISKHVGMGTDGKPMYAYLMAIDEDYYQEDLAAKEEICAKVDEGIRGGNAPGTQSLGVNPSQGGVSVKKVEYKP